MRGLSFLNFNPNTSRLVSAFRRIPALALCAILAGTGFAEKVLADDSSVMAIVLGKVAASHAERINAVKTLSRTLSTNDITALYGFLACKAGEDNTLPGELNALKNDVVNALKMQQVMPSSLAGCLMTMYGDPSHDVVWRDYCIQHLGDLYSEIKEKEVQSRALGILWAAADEKQGSIPGTALIALFGNAGAEGFGKDKIAVKALEMVRAPAYGEPARITALQIAAQLGEKLVLPDARKLAVDGSIPVRVSAMACLGLLGDKSDLQLLKDSQASTDLRLRTASQAAIKKLSTTQIQK